MHDEAVRRHQRVAQESYWAKQRAIADHRRCGLPKRERPAHLSAEDCAAFLRLPVGVVFQLGAAHYLKRSLSPWRTLVISVGGLMAQRLTCSSACNRCWLTAQPDLLEWLRRGRRDAGAYEQLHSQIRWVVKNCDASFPMSACEAWRVQ